MQNISNVFAGEADEQYTCSYLVST